LSLCIFSLVELQHVLGHIARLGIEFGGVIDVAEEREGAIEAAVVDVRSPEVAAVVAVVVGDPCMLGRDVTHQEILVARYVLLIVLCADLYHTWIYDSILSTGE